jgi:CheY-like chemotaxis protein
MQPRFASGRSRVSRALESYDMPNREAILKLLGEKGVPSMMATCPVACAGEVVGAVMLFVFDVAEDELSEWERVITLIVGLYSMGLTVEQMQQRQLPQEAASIEGLGPVVNQLNNYLSAIIGNAELGLNRDDISGDAKSQFHSVLAEAEQAAGYLKKALGELSAPEEFTQPPVAEDVQDLVPTVEDVIASSHISDNLYMIAGSPREVTFKSTASGVALLGDSNIKALFRDSLESFAALAETDDVITVSVYESGEFIYLDISRHKKNFPPVESVAGFGNYEAPQEVLKYRPSDAFLEHLNQQAAYSFDRFSRTPSYLSFKFPLSVRKLSAPARTRSTIRILAIDDQAIILDLLTAMCQSLGYEIKTASSGQEGIALASESTFDVVFTDLAMPGMSGLEVAKKIKAQHAETPIILLTGWEASVDSDRLVVSGITEVLYKPFRIEQLTDVIKSVVRSGSIS